MNSEDTIYIFQEQVYNTGFICRSSDTTYRKILGLNLGLLQSLPWLSVSELLTIIIHTRLYLIPQ